MITWAVCWLSRELCRLAAENNKRVDGELGILVLFAMGVDVVLFVIASYTITNWPQ